MPKIKTIRYYPDEEQKAEADQDVAMQKALLDFDLLFSRILQIVGLNTKNELDEIFIKQNREKTQ